jgi:CRISPR-associated protein Csx10
MSGLDPALVVQYQVGLVEPLLATALAGDPNEGVSFDYVPGSLLRGALIGKYCGQRGLDELSDAADPEAQRLFFNGKTRYLNAYPWQDKARLLPVPRSLQHPKDHPHMLTDWAIEPREITQGITWKTAGWPFGALNEDREQIRLHTPSRQIWVHSTRTRRFGRAMPAERLSNWPGELPGTVYRYDALAPEQSFCGFIVCQTTQDAETLCSLISDGAQLGGARSAGYGKVALSQPTLCSETALNDSFWRECGGPALSSGIAKGAELRLTLLSDLLLRDTNGQWCVDLPTLQAVCSARLGQVEIVEDKTFLFGTLVGGFNSKWGLPLPQALALAMGSVITLRAQTDITLEQLSDLEARGLGERRAEGFGCLAINWHNAEEWTALTFDPPKNTATRLDEQSPAQAIARDMAARMLKRRVEERLLELAYSDNYEVAGLRSKAQVARLRGVITFELGRPTPNAGEVVAFVADVRKRPSANRQFSQARLKHNNMPLLDWLDKVLPYSEGEWNDLFDIRALQTIKVAGVSAEITPALRARYLLRFVDAVLSRATKEWQRHDSNDGNRGDE